MNTNLELINAIKKNLDELIEISSKEVYGEEVTIAKIKAINKELLDLNTIQRKDILKQLDLQREVLNNMDNAVELIKEHTVLSEKVVQEVDKLLSNIEKHRFLDFNPEPLRNFEQLDLNKEITKIHTLLDSEKLLQVLSNYNYRHFARKRKQWILFATILFHSKIITISLVKLLIGSTIGYCIEGVVQKFYPSIPDFRITTGVTLIFFFTIDKFLARKHKEFFWKQVKKQTLILMRHFNLYLEHTRILIESKKRTNS